MKKLEAKALAPEKSKLVIEYITQILSDSEIRTTLAETTKPIDYIDTSKMSKKEKDNLIIEL